MSRPLTPAAPAGVEPDAARPLLVGAAVLAVALVLLARAELISAAAFALAALLWLGLAALVLRGLHTHPHERFGAANAVTTARALIAVLLGALAIDAGTPVSPLIDEAALWLATAAAILALALDGIDGALARRTGLSSPFGARYDMETDAFLALVLAILIWRTGELGAWVLALGTMRYAFVVAARLVPALTAPLYPSFRRKLVCVVQIAALCAILVPIVEPPLSVAIGVIATLALLGSFVRDTRWLLRRPGERA